VRRAVATHQAQGPATEVVEVIDEPDAAARPGWTWVTVKAATLNRHDLWAIRG
jgi:NADPH:quinone reductase-like Zn-dependent oxidoreductase